MKEQEIYTIGDIHGEYNRLKECFKKSNPKKGNKIICLGDYCDRGLYTYEVVQYLLDLKKDYEMIFLNGNHDSEFLKGLNTNIYSLMSQGCDKTIQSYIDSLKLNKQVIHKMSASYTDFDFSDMPIDHYGFFKNLLYYHIDKDNNLFVHGGFNRHKYIGEEEDKEIFLWDRDMLHSVRSYSSMKEEDKKLYPFKTKNKFKEIFIGHTPTLYFDSTTPLKFDMVNLIDTGCGKGGLLTIMNIKTKEFWQA